MNKELVNYVKEKLKETYCDNKYCSYVDSTLSQDDNVLVDNYKELLVSRFLDQKEFELKKEFPFKKDPSSLVSTKNQYVIYKKMINDKLLLAMKEVSASQKASFDEIKEDLKDYLLEKDFETNRTEISCIN